MVTLLVSGDETHVGVAGVTLHVGSKDSFSAVLSTKGRVVGACWEKLDPTGHKGKDTGLCQHGVYHQMVHGLGFRVQDLPPAPPIPPHLSSWTRHWTTPHPHLLDPTPHTPHPKPTVKLVERQRGQMPLMGYFSS